MKSSIESLRVTAYTIPTDSPESDGTLEWDSTTVIVAEIISGSVTGMGYTYCSSAAGSIMKDVLFPAIIGKPPSDINACWAAMNGSVRNLGDTGLCMMAVSAMDAALWDLKARLLDMPLVRLLGMVRREAPAYASGGFTSYSIGRLQEQMALWKEEGFSMMKMKVGRHPDDDLCRVCAAREAIGEEASLFVDANGGYGRKQAQTMARAFVSSADVSWFEEPVIHQDLGGLRQVRKTSPSSLEVSSGEYGFTLDYFRQMIESKAVDVLQADCTRCGITGFLNAASLCEAFHLPLSSHCAPSQHVHLCCAVLPVRHMEYFYDHVRIEHMLFEGAATAGDGMLSPDLTKPGMGLTLKRKEAEKFQVC